MLLLDMDIEAEVPQDFVFFKKIYINDLLDNLTSYWKLFAEDTSLFSTVIDPDITANLINNDLHNIYAWAYQW